MMPLISPWSAHSHIVKLAGPGFGRKLLDVGSGLGVLAKRLDREGWKVTTLDKNGMADLRVDLDRDWPAAEVESIGRFDTIVCADVLEHLQWPASVLWFLQRDHLLIEGRVIISIPNIAHLHRRLKLLAGDWTMADRGLLDRTHRGFYTRRTARQLVNSSLRILKESATPAPIELVWPRCPLILGKLNALLARRWPTMFGYQSIFVCEKERNQIHG